MATERQSPDALLVQTALSGAVTDIDDDPDSPDAAWLVYDGTTNGNTDCRVSFPTPTGPPNAGSGLQNFRVQIRKNASGGNATTWSLQLWENDAQIAELATGTTTALAPNGEVVAGAFDSSLLGTADGSLVECRLQQTGGGSSGSGGNRRRIEVGAIEWNVDYDDALPAQDMDAGPAVATTSAVSATLQPVANDVDATPPSATVSAVTPTLEQAAGSQEIDATPAVATVSAAAPTLELGAVELSAGPAAVSALVPAATFDLGAIEHSLAAAVALASGVAATFDLGAVELSAGPAVASASAVAATFGLPSTDVDTTPAIATASAVAPTLEPGAVTIDAGPALASTAVVACTLEAAPYELNVGVALASAMAVTPTLEVPTSGPHIPDIDALVQALTGGGI